MAILRDDNGKGIPTGTTSAQVPANMAAIAAGLEQFATDANAGKVTVNEDAGQLYYLVFNELETWIRSHLDKFHNGARIQGYGSTHGGKLLQPAVQAMSGGPGGIIEWCDHLVQRIPVWRESVQKALANYRESDAASAAALKKIMEEE
jgi:hypothetical protein